MIDDGASGRLQSVDTLGVLAKEFGVRLLNCSASGCLMETNARIDIGTVASLRVVWNGDEITEDVQIVRCQQIEGSGSIFHVGAQFLWTSLPGERSLRRAMRQVSGLRRVG